MNERTNYLLNICTFEDFCAVSVVVYVYIFNDCQETLKAVLTVYLHFLKMKG